MSGFLVHVTPRHTDRAKRSLSLPPHLDAEKISLNPEQRNRFFASSAATLNFCLTFIRVETNEPRTRVEHTSVCAPRSYVGHRQRKLERWVEQNTHPPQFWWKGVRRGSKQFYVSLVRHLGQKLTVISGFRALTWVLTPWPWNCWPSGSSWTLDMRSMHWVRTR